MVGQRLNRRAFIRASCAALGASALWSNESRVQAAEKTPPNVLFIGADDLRTELNCYGRSHIHSPNIDRLATGGVLFEHAYVQQAVCAASRASLLTGCRPDTTGADYPYSMYFVEQFLPGHPSLPAYFHRQGYFTRTLGKIHHGYSEDFTEPDFSPNTGGNYALPVNRAMASGQKYGPPFEMAGVPDNAYRDGILAEEAVATLQRAAKSDAPFFLAVGFHKPHLPFCAPQKYWDLYPPESITLAPNPEHPTDSPPYSTWHYELGQYTDPNDSNKKPVPEEYAKTLRRGYYACVSYMDAQVGRLLDELERLGLSQNTLVIYWGDHGFHLGEHAMWCKETNFELDTHAPLIVRGPGVQAGARCPAFVEYVDMFPTITELAGVPTPDYLEGASMVPLLQNPKRPWKSAAFSQFPRGLKLEGYAMRTERHRYVEWWNKERDGARVDIAAIELYDCIKDPMETLNVAGIPENKELVSQLSAQLAAGWRSAWPEGSENQSKNPTAPPPVPWSSKRTRGPKPEKSPRAARPQGTGPPEQ
jgi:arylsulfatase A-like enzyme